MISRLPFTVLVCSLLNALFISQAGSEEIRVEYKTFYSHVSKLKGEQTNALQFAFGFLNIHTNQLCEINAARISTQKQQIPLEISAENRFTIPRERALRLADASLVIDLAEKANVCDISVQLETKSEYLKDTYSKEEFDMLFSQYKTFFDDMGGFMSFMMPEVEGLNFQFEDNSLDEKLSNGRQIENGILQIRPDEFSLFDRIWLRHTPKRITALTVKK